MVTWFNMMFMNPSTFNMIFIIFLNDFIVMILSSIVFLVLMEMILILSLKTFHLNFYENEDLEITWTIVPFFILMVILIPSLKFLYMMDSIFIPALSILVIGHQWYWSYNIKFLNYFFDSYMEKNGSLRLIETDNNLVLGSGINYRVLGTSADVIHSWTIPSAGFKMDVMPGRLNQMHLFFNKSGLFYGQCSEICGINHSFMPIFIESININEFLKNF